MTTTGYLHRGVAAPYALPVTFAAYLAVGTAAAALDGHFTAAGVLIACAVVAGLMAFITEPLAAALIAGIGWLTVVGFSRPPYAQLRLTGSVARDAAIALGIGPIQHEEYGQVRVLVVNDLYQVCRLLTMRAGKAHKCNDMFACS